MNSKILSLAFLSLFVANTALAQDYHKYPFVPDPIKTPGLINKQITKEEVCTQSTKQIRHVTYAISSAVYKSYKLKADSKCCELDHFIPLELGGLNTILYGIVTDNLWPQQYEIYAIINGTRIRLGAHEKDLVENHLHHRVCIQRIWL